ncbi:MAG TPA: ABC transporter ATP-binding protein [Methanofastidiosum sp.]|jgi:ABC-2 type transport system ATP-binding protein|nr:ABC transporter ATP-binding protein [Methanofastidiosum sp.]HPU90601.1 ABC transporter ATP-binding protein [Methanofastidiosum sp.]HPX23788.1 ABC transporter ATP-binding protein [Methanofastidiosum sp.]HQC24647.1 ABC transporter ATP-binding protein [Methanofastidiosum sp.]
MIEFLNVSKYFGRHKALDEVTIRIEDGATIGIVGPNGAGKTTLIRLLCGILNPSEGQILIGGKDLQKNSSEIKKIIGYLPEEPNLYERPTAGELLEYFGLLYGVPKDKINQKIDELLDLVGLSNRKDWAVSSFSKGMRQRLAISRALIHDPKIIVFDEPTMGLDPLTSKKIREFITTLKKEKTIILCTHYMYEAEQLCDKIAIIDKGKIKAYDTVQNLKDAYIKEKTFRIGLKEMKEELLNKISLTKNLRIEKIGKDYIILKTKSYKDLKYILEEEITYFEDLTPSLEEVFIKLVGSKND